jgi:hypothetical protein
MTRDNEAPGTATGPGELRIERWLPGPAERIWAYLTDSEKRGAWLAPGEMELRVGGRVEHRSATPTCPTKGSPRPGTATTRTGTSCTEPSLAASRPTP